MIELFSEAVTEEGGTSTALVPDRNHVFNLRFSGSSIGKTPAIIGDQRILELDSSSQNIPTRLILTSCRFRSGRFPPIS